MTSGSTNVTSFLLQGKDLSQVALRMLDRDYTYGDVQSASSAIANHLIATGGRKGDRVLLSSENSLFWVGAYLGILRAGLVCVPLPTGIAAEDLEYILHASEAHLALVQLRFAATHKDRLQELQLVTDREAPGLTNATTFAKVLTASAGTDDAVAEVQSNDLAALMFTSGSTGRPRGVMVSHRNIIANTESIVEYLNLTAVDRTMTVLPFHY